ncbi:MULTISPECIES: methylated-DNA--[protein]-cysteine S-methyltransferase [unclassified Streptomyces]|uniref:methylated-DNA--[protein]-cysteine S-methyltransferase n=1 Tax=unclassified Streptomyces TaxID=2593676 RepID=UPI000CD5AC3D|nr:MULTISPECIES: methylated-DNA--[protein]-cysteine S-methyltransferase [unclassified Streptomyces]
MSDSPPEIRTAPDGQTLWTLRASPVGPLLLTATGRGLSRVVFHADEAVTGSVLSRPTAGGGTASGDPTGHLLTASGELDAYFGGTLRRFTVPLDWDLAPGFTGRVLRELLAAVPYGAVTGYRELALRLDEPGAARAVGAAMGANPLPVIVPCHRVVAADGRIGGFSGGLETKRTLLALEGVLPAPMF